MGKPVEIIQKKVVKVKILEWKMEGYKGDRARGTVAIAYYWWQQKLNPGIANNEHCEIP